MATVTVTLSSCLPKVAPRAAHGASPAVVFVESASGVAFGTAGDTLLLAKLPNGSRIANIMGHYDVDGATSQLVRLLLLEVQSIGAAGTLGTLSVRADIPMGTLTCPTGANNLPGAGLVRNSKVSISDAAAVQFDLLALRVVSGSNSLSVSLQLAVTIENSGL